MAGLCSIRVWRDGASWRVCAAYWRGLSAHHSGMEGRYRLLASSEPCLGWSGRQATVLTPPMRNGRPLRDEDLFVGIFCLRACACDLALAILRLRSCACFRTLLRYSDIARAILRVRACTRSLLLAALCLRPLACDLAHAGLRVRACALRACACDLAPALARLRLRSCACGCTRAVLHVQSSSLLLACLACWGQAA